MLEVTVASWIASFSIILGLLAFDWLRFGRRPHVISLADAARWSVFYFGASVAFGVVFSLISGWNLGAQFFAGYLVEKSLSVDNLFVFVLIIGAFAVPAAHQAKVLSIGIVIALVLRGAVIATGAALLELFSVVLLIFGASLLITAVQLFRHRHEDPHTEDNLLVRIARRSLPLTDTYNAGRLITTRGGRRLLTPMFLALLAIGTTDLLFALDSIPAVFGVTDHVYIVFVANAFALLGLRPLFFLVSGLLGRLAYMASGLAVVLGFIGIKLGLEFAHRHVVGVPEISTAVSLAVIGLVLTVTVVASLIHGVSNDVGDAEAGPSGEDDQPESRADGQRVPALAHSTREHGLTHRVRG